MVLKKHILFDPDYGCDSYKERSFPQNKPTGCRLILYYDLSVEGSSNFTYNVGENGFGLTFDSMTEGQEITITYSANVNFLQDTDGDGKITADQTKNTVTVEPEGGRASQRRISKGNQFQVHIKRQWRNSGLRRKR